MSLFDFKGIRRREREKSKSTSTAENERANCVFEKEKEEMKRERESGAVDDDELANWWKGNVNMKINKLKKMKRMCDWRRLEEDSRVWAVWTKRERKRERIFWSSFDRKRRLVIKENREEKRESGTDGQSKDSKSLNGGCQQKMKRKKKKNWSAKMCKGKNDKLK